MTKSVFFLIAALLLSSNLMAESAADGVWNFAMSSQMGSVDATVTIETSGSSLTGLFDVGGGRTWVMEEGTVDGNVINFKINRDGAAMTYVMAGTVEGNSIKGTASAMGSVVDWTMSKEG
ncbi:MAG: hypothetical protein AB8B95_06095 [Pseudohongiellaceae bacterium]